MPNRNSKAGHIPHRLCVVCKKSIDHNRLLSFFIIREGVVFDMTRQLPGRRNYLCPNPECLDGFDKWKKRYHKRSFASVARQGGKG